MPNKIDMTYNYEYQSIIALLLIIINSIIHRSFNKCSFGHLKYIIFDSVERWKLNDHLNDSIVDDFRRDLYILDNNWWVSTYRITCTWCYYSPTSHNTTKKLIICRNTNPPKPYTIHHSSFIHSKQGCCDTPYS